VAITRALKILATHGSFNLAGQAVNLQVARKILAEHGFFVLMGQDVDLVSDATIYAKIEGQGRFRDLEGRGYRAFSSLGNARDYEGSGEAVVRLAAIGRSRRYELRGE